MDNYFLDLEYISQTKINDYIIMSRLIELEVGKQQSFWATNLLQQDGLYIYIFRFWFLPDSDDEGCTVFDFGLLIYLSLTDKKSFWIPLPESIQLKMIKYNGSVALLSHNTLM